MTNADDSSWAPLARASRQALALLGHDIAPRCLPDEDDACGGTFAQHAAAHLATLSAVVDHHLDHLGSPMAGLINEIYEHASAEAALACNGCEQSLSS